MFRFSNAGTESHRGAVASWTLLGAAVALLLTISVAALYLVGGDDRFAANGVTLGGTILTYWIGCPLGGALIGWTRPFAASPIGAAIAGVLGVFPLYVAAVATMTGPPWTWPLIRWLGALVPSLVVGGALGVTWLRSRPNSG